MVLRDSGSSLCGSLEDLEEASLGLLIGYSFLILTETVLNRKPFVGEHIQLELFWSWKQWNVQKNQILTNVVMFIPIGVLASFMWKWKGLWFAAGLSLLVEVLQLATSRGLFEFDDVLHNIIGAVVGVGIVMVAGKKLKWWNMISVIVPVYNVEPYLRKCLDSILGQTYRDLEILVIDDGSTDGSGEICEEYRTDERVKVFHTENRGLSCARNLGLAEAQGEWIGFVDSDDWIDSGMYQTLLQKAEETGAEIVECGIFREFSNRTLERKRKDLSVFGIEAVDLLLQGKIKDYAWDKLWSRRCFEDIRFPEGRVHEDTAVAYKLLFDAERVSILSTSLYHYWKRKGSLSQT